MLKHAGEIPLDGLPALDAKVKSDGSQVGVAPPQLLPGVGGGVSEVIQISKVPSPKIPATLTFTCAPAAYAQLADATPPALAAASHVLNVAEPQAASDMVITACCMGVAPLGVMVIVLEGPATINENQTSLTATALQMFVVLLDVAPTDVELMQTVPLGGMITG
jgi:hypothetical protein